MRPISATGAKFIVFIARPQDLYQKVGDAGGKPSAMGERGGDFEQTAEDKSLGQGGRQKMPAAAVQNRRSQKLCCGISPLGLRLALISEEA